jgi:hypothetical protein
MTENLGAKYAISDVCGALDRCKDFLGHYMPNLEGLDAMVVAKQKELAEVKQELAVALADLKKAQDRQEDVQREIKKMMKEIA